MTATTYVGAGMRGMSPYRVYVFGNIGGPFKVGYSNNPKVRAGGIRAVRPGSIFASRHATFWYLRAALDETSAKETEEEAHRLLRPHRVWLRPSCQNTEWFATDLGRVVKAVDAASRTVFSDLPGEELEALDRWRKGSGLTRSDAIRSALEIAFQHKAGRVPPSGRGRPKTKPGKG